jgi:hypothetical protein
MTRSTVILLLAGLAAGTAAHAAEPASAPADGTQAALTAAIDPATGKLRAPTAAEQAQLRAAAARMRTTGKAQTLGYAVPRTRAEAERTMRRHADGHVSMQVSEDMMSQVTAEVLPDGSVRVTHGEAATGSAVHE